MLCPRFAHEWPLEKAIVEMLEGGERVNIVIYARYSSRSQTEQSIEGQLQICYEFAKNNGHTVIGEYIDRAQSGTTDSRAEFQRMISDSDKHSFEGVLVYQLVMIKITARQGQAGWADERFSGRAAGVVQQPGGAFCAALCIGAEKPAVFQHAFAGF